MKCRLLYSCKQVTRWPLQSARWPRSPVREVARYSRRYGASSFGIVFSHGTVNLVAVSHSHCPFKPILQAASGGSELSVQKDVCKREENISEASNTTTPLDLSLRTSSAAVAASSQSASSASCDVEGAGESKRPHEEHSQAAAVDTIQNPNPVSLQQ